MVNVRNEPNAHGNILYQLRIGSNVYLIKKAGNKVRVGEISGEWFLIDTNHYKQNTRETIKGWVLDSFLLTDFSKFTKLMDLNFKKCNFNYTIGDSYFSYEFYKDGTFTLQNIDNYLNKKNSKIKGYLYQFKNLIMAKDSNGQTQTFFYINDEGYICDTYFNLRGKSACSTCQFKK